MKKLADICTYISRGITPKYVEIGRPIINQKCIRNWALDILQARQTDSQKNISGDKLLQANDILINSTGVGTVGRVAQYYGKSGDLTVDSHVMIVRPDPNIVHPKYLGYVLKSRQHVIELLAEGSTGQIELSRAKLSDMQISLPPMSEQKRIANILGSLDDKIELNRQMNETLEKMGMTLFRHYFIDNPEAKNWKVAKLGDVLETIESGSRPKGGATASGIPSIGAENITGLGQYDYSKEKYISRQYFNKLKRGRIKSGDVLLYKDGAYVGRSSMFANGFPHDKAAVNEHVFILRSDTNVISQVYLYFWVNQEKIVKQIKDAGIRAAQPGINQQNVKELAITIPARQKLLTFNDACNPIIDRVFNNAVENRLLAKERDMLLARLIACQ